MRASKAQATGARENESRHAPVTAKRRRRIAFWHDILIQVKRSKLEYENAVGAVLAPDLNMTFRQTSTRAGRYIKQTTGYQAFVPAPLPPNPHIAFDDAFLEVLSRADRAVGRLDGCAETLPNSELFVFMYIRKEAVLSSQIEGTQASLMDVLEFEAATRAGVPTDLSDVFNYVAAMDHGLARLETLPLSLRLIREIHAKLLFGVRGARDAGEFRDKQNWIGPAGSLLMDAVYVPPAPPDMHQALDSLEKFLHDKNPMPYLVRTGIAHAYFETIHPFVDGNGRLGRLLITFMLCEQRILSRPLLYLSFFLKKNRSEYYDRLQAVRDSGQWEQWLKFFLRGVAEVAEEATATARKIVQLREQHRRLAMDLGRSTSRALVLLESLYRQPVVSLTQISEVCDITFQGASDLAKHFCSLGILKETTGQRRHRLFAYGRYLALLGERLRKKSGGARARSERRNERGRPMPRTTTGAQ
ncbi:MAG TPA: Fic family protein [Bryobacteraceae bacterium]|nr:Fic family protein [Bryobacteraceae bacterium]